MNKEWSLEKLYTGYDDPRFTADEAELDQLIKEFTAVSGSLTGDPKEILKKADSVFYAIGMKSNNQLFYEVADKAPYVDIIGDAAQTARIGEAVAGGYFAAMDIGTF